MVQRSRDPARACAAAAPGVRAGALTYAATGTAMVMMSPGLDVGVN